MLNRIETALFLLLLLVQANGDPVHSIADDLPNFYDLPRSGFYCVLGETTREYREPRWPPFQFTQPLEYNTLLNPWCSITERLICDDPENKTGGSWTQYQYGLSEKCEHAGQFHNEAEFWDYDSEGNEFFCCENRAKALDPEFYPSENLYYFPLHNCNDDPSATPEQQENKKRACSLSEMWATFFTDVNWEKHKPCNMRRYPRNPKPSKHRLGHYSGSVNYQIID